MLAVHIHRLARFAFSGHSIVPPDVAAIFHGGRIARILMNNHRFHRIATHFQGFIHYFFHWDILRAPGVIISSEHHTYLRIFDAVGQRHRTESGKDNRMNSTDPGACQYCHHQFGGHGHINTNAVALFHSLIFQRIGKLANELI